MSFELERDKITKSLENYYRSEQYSTNPPALQYYFGFYVLKFVEF